ncbi:MAG TPA: hypothetical protein VFO55_01470 [Gemmatimonadaceae bacterium]|nr:hypothetical protein [Gemmatimonadaceae bacterium]
MPMTTSSWRTRFAAALPLRRGSRAAVLLTLAVAASCGDNRVLEPNAIGSSAALATALPNTVLILSPTVYPAGSASSQEAVAAAGLGFSVVFKNATEWAAMTAADFAQYRAIILGDPRCTGITSAQAAVNNRMVWGPVIDGNVFIIGTDPAYHNKALVAQKGIAFATAAAGRTGAYITTSCYSTSAASLLLGLSSVGTFTAVGTAGNNALKVANHPSLDGLTSAYLSNWGASVHNGFSVWPSDFEVLGIIGTGTVYRSPDGLFVGTPYILARGEGLVVVSDIALTPLSATLPINESHTFTAKVQANGAPASGVVVTFTVEDGPTAGATATATTDAAGEATYVLTSATAATYGVRARFVDSRGITQTSSRATATFEQPSDASAPVITPSIAGTEGTGDWYTSDVALTWTVVDDESPITSQAGCTASSVTVDGSQEFTCTATSAGGTASRTVTIKRDATAPTLDAVVAGTLGAGGWYIGDVAVSWTHADPTSGIDTHDHDGVSDGSCQSGTVSSDTNGITFTCTIHNGAGLATTKSVTVKRDASAPTVFGTPSGDLGSNGWYRSPVTVTWTTADNVSGASSCAPNTLSADNSGTTFSCTTTNGAGLTQTASLTVKKDGTAPIVAYGNNAGTYTVDQQVGITCSATDNLSGVMSSTCAPVSGPAYTFGVGTTTRSASATDFAGNVGSASTSFQVVVTSASLCELTKRFVSQAGIANSLCAKLNAAGASSARGRPATADNQYQAYVNEVSAQSGKALTASNAAILIQLANQL